MILGGSSIRTFILKFQFLSLEALSGFQSLITGCISSSLLISHGMRMDVNLILLFGDNVYLRFEPRRLKYVRPDEQSTLGVVSKAIYGATRLKNSSGREFSPGVFGGRASLSYFLKKGRHIYYSHRRGVRLDFIKVDRNPTLVICYPDYGVEDLSVLSSFNAKPIRISFSYNYPPNLIIIFQNHCDRLFYGGRWNC